MAREDMRVVGVSDRDAASRRNWRLDPLWRPLMGAAERKRRRRLLVLALLVLVLVFYIITLFVPLMSNTHYMG